MKMPFKTFVNVSEKIAVDLAYKFNKNVKSKIVKKERLRAPFTHLAKTH